MTTNGIEQLRNYIKNTEQFNVFRIFKMENYEIRHSNFLAWLLNPAETHDFGNCFLKEFIHVINEKIKYNDDDKIEIYREQENIDILILNKTQNYLILIENKINSKQHDNQLKRYEEIVKKELDPHYTPYFVCFNRQEWHCV